VLHQAGTATLDGAGYTYDNAGNRTAKANYLNNITEQYTYDPLYQLTQVTQGTTTTESYSYDAVGNRLASLGMSPYAYNSSNELTSTPNATFTYDSNGNTLTKADSSGTTTYNWNFENRLTSVALPGTSGMVTFKYDPFGRRIEKSSINGTTSYLYDGSNSIAELDGAGTLLARYAQGGGIDEPLAELRSETTGYYAQDGLGSVTSIAGSNGTLLNSDIYDSFGNVVASTGEFGNPLQYTGRDFDSETGLRYYRARYYDPTIGRFISEDPLRFGGGDSFYVYSEDNPASLVDPFGLQGSTAFNNAWSTLGDLGRWIFGTRGGQGLNDHWNDGVTDDLRKSPAWDDIVNQLKKKHCVSGRYCGQFEFKQVFRPHNFNLTIQTVGSFCADITFQGNVMIVDAFNEWGLQSLTRIPGTNYHSPTLQDMIFNSAKKGTPSSIFDNTRNGPMRVQRFHYHWRQISSCCGN